MRRKITSVAIMSAMVLMGFVVAFGGQTAASPGTYYLREVPYEWDTSADPPLLGGSGTPLNAEDDSEHYVTLDHSFTLYDMTTSVMTISSNGWVKMGVDDSYMTYSNYAIGTEYYDADYALMPFWDDLNPYAGGEIYFYTSTSKTVVTWWEVPHYDNTGIHTFQLVLRADGTFQFNYKTIEPPCPNYYSSPTVGVVKENNVVDGTQFYYTDGYYELRKRVKSEMSVGLGTPPPRVAIFGEDFESGIDDWELGWDSYPVNLWHITEHRSVSPTHSLYYGREPEYDYDIGYNYGMIRSPWITIDGPNPELEFQTFYRSEAMDGTYYDRQLIYMSRNHSPIYDLQTQVFGEYYGNWHTITASLSANEGDEVQFLFYFNTIDSIDNYYEGWYIDDVFVTVESACGIPRLGVASSGFMRETIAAGGGGIAYVTVENIVCVPAIIKSHIWTSPNITIMHELGGLPASRLAPGESQTYYVAVHVNAGTQDHSVQYLDFTLEYNNRNDLMVSIPINILWKETGGNRSEYIHSQDALRHIRRLDYNIKNGYVANTGALENAIDEFVAGRYTQAKKIAANEGGPGLGFYGLAPGQIEGNEGNGNGGLAGP